MSAFSPARRDRITRRAGHRCEYCRLPTRGQVATFPIDHILPRSEGGSNSDANLALTCPHCNACKWTYTAGQDPATGQPSRYYDPRRDEWADHFEWTTDGTGKLIGRTAVGLATVVGLRLNDPDMTALRALLAELGLFPEVGG